MTIWQCPWKLEKQEVKLQASMRSHRNRALLVSFEYSKFEAVLQRQSISATLSGLPDDNMIWKWMSNIRTSKQSGHVRRVSLACSHATTLLETVITWHPRHGRKALNRTSISTRGLREEGGRTSSLSFMDELLHKLHFAPQGILRQARARPLD